LRAGAISQYQLIARDALEKQADGHLAMETPPNPRDTKLGKEVTDFLNSSGIKPKRIGYRCPGQNGIAERCVPANERLERINVQ
jgi:hypothetical protein